MDKKILIIGLLFFLSMNLVSAYSLQEYMFDNGLSNVSDVRCIDFRDAIALNTGWNDSVYCSDELTSDIVYVQGNFSYGHHPDNSVSDIPEFSIIGLLFIVVTIIGVFIVRKGGFDG